MNRLYLFNPDNDMALASFSPYYKAPRSATKMAADLSALPAWFAEGGEASVFLSSDRQQEWMEQNACFPLSVSYTTQLSSIYMKVCPWGWNPALRRSLSEGGLAEDCLPTQEELQQIRLLSSRELAVDVLQQVHVPGTLGESHLLRTCDEVLDFLQTNSRALLKAPWSGSGKGIRPVWTAPDESLLGWIKRILHTQGAIAAEPFYDKVLDFAMEFRMEAGRIQWVGYSLFETDHRGAYKGNALLSNEQIEQKLSPYVSVEVLRQVSFQLAQILENRLSARYEGYLGVDMMICRQEAGGFAVHPCVEVNLRMNMGVVARLFYDRYVHPHSQGSYVVAFYSQPGEALSFHQEQISKHPFQLLEGRMQRGYLSLTPVFADTTYQVYVLLDEGRPVSHS